MKFGTTKFDLADVTEKNAKLFYFFNHKNSFCLQILIESRDTILYLGDHEKEMNIQFVGISNFEIIPRIFNHSGARIKSFCVYALHAFLGCRKDRRLFVFQTFTFLIKIFGKPQN